MPVYPMITISREYGSNGHKIGELLSEKLGIPFYDKDVISIAAKETRMPEESFEKAETKAASGSLGYAMSNRGTKIYGMPINDQMFYAQSSIIRTLADRGPAIFVGRCADYVLSGYKESIDIFLWAGKDKRIQTVMEREKLSQEQAADEVRIYDKGRSTYYTYYTDRKWGDIKNYDISLNVGYLTPEEAADILVTFINQVMEKTGAIERVTGKKPEKAK